ncbi:MAG TPA: MBL fold metallo-hydrolase [Xanthobacteraceae bacterium]|jgi:beta-lactamase superfamily II metal-dependent hydrolase
MKRASPSIAAIILALAASAPAFPQDHPAPTAQSGKLSMYWIDTEGGAATLIVSPTGESLLIDTGFPDADRDAKRIYSAARQAGLDHIDHLVISHWHRDHEGGLAAFAKMMPISRFYDHGDTASPEDQGRLEDYRAVAGNRRVIVKPGDKIPMKDLDVLVVTSDQKQIANPVNGGGPNPLCANAQRMAPAAPENLRTVGVLLSYNKFTYLNLVDLDWYKDMELACPINKVGKVTVYQTSRHGGLDDAGSPPFLGAISPQVVIVNNGPRKGLGQTDNRAKPIADPHSAPYERNSYLRMAKLPGLEDIWQQHLSLLDKDPNHNTAENMIANVEETADCKGNWISASVAPDGKFTVVNGRNGYSKNYVTRPASQ